MMTIAERFWNGEGLRNILVIDAHAHLGRWQSFYTPQLTIKQMIAEMDRHGIDITVVSSLLAIAVDTQRGNDDTLRALAEYPGRFLGYVSLNPHRPIAENRDEFLRCRDRSEAIIGIKLHPMWHAYPASGELYMPLWEMAAEHSALVLGHCWLGSEEPEQYAAPVHYGKVARQFPEVTIILGHSGGTDAGHRECASLCHELGNLYMDICAAEFSGTWVQRLLDFAPSDRVLFATDSPFLGVGSPVGRVALAEIDDRKKEQIFGENMARVIRDKAPWAAHQFLT